MLPLVPIQLTRLLSRFSTHHPGPSREPPRRPPGHLHFQLLRRPKFRATMTRFSPLQRVHKDFFPDRSSSRFFFNESSSDRLENHNPGCFSKFSFRVKFDFGSANSIPLALMAIASMGRHTGDPTGHHRSRLGAGGRFSALGTDCSLCRLQRGPWGPPVSDHHVADCVSTSHSPTISGPDQDHQPGSKRWVGVGVGSNHMPPAPAARISKWFSISPVPPKDLFFAPNLQLLNQWHIAVITELNTSRHPRLQAISLASCTPSGAFLKSREGLDADA